MRKNLISVVVPIYNSEKYLVRCIESILSQQGVDIELILVNDGSIDSSLKICRKYEKNNANVKVIDMINNSGSSRARNVGISVAKGDFITFVDSDDFILPNIYKKSMDNFINNKVDIVVFEMQKANSLNTKNVPFKHKNINDNFIKYSVHMHSVCNKIFRMELIKKNNIKFCENISLCEDMIFSFFAISKSVKIEYIKEKGYVYWENLYSISHSDFARRNIADYEKVYQIVQSYCKNNSYGNKYNKFIKYRKMYWLIMYLTNINFFDPYKFREKSKKKDIWLFNGRVDLLIISLCSQLSFDLPARLYISIKKNLYSRSKS